MGIAEWYKQRGTFGKIIILVLVVLATLMVFGEKKEQTILAEIAEEDYSGTATYITTQDLAISKRMEITAEAAPSTNRLLSILLTITGGIEKRIIEPGGLMRFAFTYINDKPQAIRLNAFILSHGPGVEGSAQAICSGTSPYYRQTIDAASLSTISSGQSYSYSQTRQLPTWIKTSADLKKFYDACTTMESNCKQEGNCHLYYMQVVTTDSSGKAVEIFRSEDFQVGSTAPPTTPTEPLPAQIKIVSVKTDKISYPQTDLITATITIKNEGGTIASGFVEVYTYGRERLTALGKWTIIAPTQQFAIGGACPKPWESGRGVSHSDTISVRPGETRTFTLQIDIPENGDPWYSSSGSYRIHAAVYPECGNPYSGGWSDSSIEPVISVTQQVVTPTGEVKIVGVKPLSTEFGAPGDIIPIEVTIDNTKSTPQTVLIETYLRTSRPGMTLLPPTGSSCGGPERGITTLKQTIPANTKAFKTTIPVKTQLPGDTGGVYATSNIVYRADGRYWVQAAIYTGCTNEGGKYLQGWWSNQLDGVTIVEGKLPSIDDEFLPPVPFLDTDEDGLVNNVDECPDEVGPEINSGCPLPTEEDTDGDGVLNINDACPTRKGPISTNGCPINEPLVCTNSVGAENEFNILGTCVKKNLVYTATGGLIFIVGAYVILRRKK